MAFSLNKIQLLGNLGDDANVRIIPNSTTKVTEFSLATTYGYKDKSGEWVNETTWHKITSYNLPESYDQYLKKGSKLYVEGRLKKSSYVDKDGINRQVVEVVTNLIIPYSDKAKAEDGVGEEIPEVETTA